MLGRILAMSAAVLVMGVVAAGTAQAQSQCDCTATVTGPKAGRHSGDVSGVDVVLWPPNHKLHEVSIEAVDSTGDPCDVEILTVTQDEAIDAPGSGNTTGADAENCSNDGDQSSVDLRAERTGGGNGRFYDIQYTMTDDTGNTCEDQHAIALVPHDQRKDQSGWKNDGTTFPSGVVCAPGDPAPQAASMSSGLGL